MSGQYLPNYSLTADEILLDFVNDQNGTTYTAEEVTVGPTSTHSGAKNSKFTLTATPANAAQGSQTFYYNRKALTDLNGDVLDIESDGIQATMADLLSDVNTYFNIALTADDIVDAALAHPEPGTDDVLNLVIKPDHGLFNGGCSIRFFAPGV